MNIKKKSKFYTSRIATAVNKAMSCFIDREARCHGLCWFCKRDKTGQNQVHITIRNTDHDSARAQVIHPCISSTTASSSEHDQQQRDCPRFLQDRRLERNQPKILYLTQDDEFPFVWYRCVLPLETHTQKELNSIGELRLICPLLVSKPVNLRRK